MSPQTRLPPRTFVLIFMVSSCACVEWMVDEPGWSPMVTHSQIGVPQVRPPPRTFVLIFMSSSCACVGWMDEPGRSPNGDSDPDVAAADPAAAANLRLDLHDELLCFVVDASNAQDASRSSTGGNTGVNRSWSGQLDQPARGSETSMAFAVQSTRIPSSTSSVSNKYGNTPPCAPIM